METNDGVLNKQTALWINSSATFFCYFFIFFCGNRNRTILQRSFHDKHYCRKNKDCNFLNCWLLIPFSKNIWSTDLLSPLTSIMIFYCQKSFDNCPTSKNFSHSRSIKIATCMLTTPENLYLLIFHFPCKVALKGFSIS